MVSDYLHVETITAGRTISDEASFITGAEIAVDGGQSAHGGAKSLSDAVFGVPAATPTNEEKRDADG